MFRVAICSAVFALLLQPVSAQVFNTGIPAGATSPRADGRQNGIPAGATSPIPRPFGVNPTPHLHPRFSSGHVQQPLRPFGSQRHRQSLPQVPLFYPIYPMGYDYYSYPPSVADPMVSQEVDPAPAADNADDVARSEDALRQAYLQGARDALTEQQRGRQDALAASRTAPPAKPSAPSTPPASAKAPEPDNSPSAVFIFKDGRRLEIKNYAIMGQTLYDLSDGVLKKVRLTDLDTVATVKANDDRGITVKLP